MIARQVVARKILEFLGEKSPSKATLDKTTWCVRYWNRKGSSPGETQLSFSMDHLPLVDSSATNKTISEIIKLSFEMADKVTKDDMLRSCTAENNILKFDLDHTFTREAILHEILRKRDTYGLESPQHSLRQNANGTELEPMPQNERVVIEYSSPNIAKPFHAGHLRSTLLGNFLANLNAGLGHQVTRINYLGDWGTQYGYLGLAFGKYGSEEKLQEDPLDHLYNIYVKINEDANVNPDIHQDAVQLFSKMEQGDQESTALWKRFRDLSVEEYNKVYQRLGVRFDVTDGESLHSEGCRKLVEDLKTRNLLKFNPEGVGYVDLSESGSTGNPQPSIIRSNGTTLYLTRDIAAFLQRKEKYRFDRMHYVVENGQYRHFQQLEEILKLIDVPEKFASGLHVKFGRISGLSTRKGNVVFLKDVLDEARSRMIQNMQEAATTKVTENIEEVADILGVSAIIIQDLKQSRQKHYPFDWDKMLSFRGRTGVYLQYAHARLCNLERNCGVPLNKECDLQHLDNIPSAWKLLLYLGRYDLTISAAFDQVEPMVVAHYVLELANLANAANRDLTVKGQPAHIAEARLLLFHCTQQVLANGMRLLGLQPLDKL